MTEVHEFYTSSGIKKIVEFEPYNNVEAKNYIEEYLGSSLIKIVSRRRYEMRVVVKTEEGEKETIVSLPRHIRELS